MSSASALADEQGRKVFLGGLSYDATEEDLRADFGKFGPLDDVQLPMGDGGKHKGFAFLTYRDAEDAQYAVKKHHQQPYLGREISAKIVVPRNERGGGDSFGGRGGERPGDWTCPSCSASVFGSKSACFKCGEPKPSGGGRGRRDDRDRRDDYDDRRRGDDRRRDRRDDYDDRRRDDYDDRRRDRRDDPDDRRRDDYDDRRRDRRDDDRRRRD
ncbi:hypothetical protein AB1Y20_006606 [Prymnesium parvum]|uniref:RRM domain-containing protein n=1 Tax=Prymnesium parvum TaxID=97485 RepID=A0AB34IZB2_PRYPA